METASRGLTSWECDIIQQGVKRITASSLGIQRLCGSGLFHVRLLQDHMDVLSRDVRSDLFYRYGHIFTKVRDDAPAKYCDSAQSPTPASRTAV